EGRIEALPWVCRSGGISRQGPEFDGRYEQDAWSSVSDVSLPFKTSQQSSPAHPRCGRAPGPFPPPGSHCAGGNAPSWNGRPGAMTVQRQHPYPGSLHSLIKTCEIIRFKTGGGNQVCETEGWKITRGP